MWTRSYSTETNKVNAGQMYNLFADVNNWASWDPGVEHSSIEGPFAAGNHFMLRPKGGPDVKVELLETEPNRRFLDVTSFPLAKMYDEHLFEATPNGLKITNTITVKGPLSFLWVKLVASKIAASLPEDVANQINAAQKL